MRLHNRQVKAKFWQDTELIQAVPLVGRMFYQGLWQLADDSGCLEDDPVAWKLHLFALDAEVTLEVLSDWAGALKTLRKLVPYEAAGKRCLYLVNFHKHQSIKNPSPPDTPLPRWVKWEPFQSNSRAGKYIVSDPSEGDFLPMTDGVLTDGLQSSSNLNLNPNLEPKPDPEEEAAPARDDTPPPEPEKPEGWSDLLCHFNSVLRHSANNPDALRELQEWAEAMGCEVVRRAINEASDNGAAKWNYARKCLVDWHEAGARTAADIDRLTAEHKRKRSRGSRDSPGGASDELRRKYEGLG